MLCGMVFRECRLSEFFPFGFGFCDKRFCVGTDTIAARVSQVQVFLLVKKRMCAMVFLHFRIMTIKLS